MEFNVLRHRTPSFSVYLIIVVKVQHEVVKSLSCYPPFFINRQKRNLTFRIVCVSYNYDYVFNDESLSLSLSQCFCLVCSGCEVRKWKVFTITLNVSRIVSDFTRSDLPSSSEKSATPRFYLIRIKDLWSKLSDVISLEILIQIIRDFHHPLPSIDLSSFICIIYTPLVSTKLL